MLKKLLTSVLIVFFIFIFVGNKIIAFAQTSSPTPAPGPATTWYSQGFMDWYSKVYDKTISPSNEIFGERYTAAQVQWILYSIPSTIINMIPGNPDLFLCVVGGSVSFENCLGTLDDELRNILNPVAQATNNQSVLGAFLKGPSSGSFSGIGYFKNLARKISPVSSVKAVDGGAGTGFDAGESIVPLWRITRNLSYSLLVIAAVIVAFMIMFRVKINPQTVITIQSAIPKLIVAIILITFSYAIAGFVVDLMYLIIGLFSTIISSSGLSGYNPGELFAKFTNEYSGFGIMYAYWWHLFANSLGAIANSGKQWWAAIIFFVIAIVVIIPTIYWSFKIIFVLIKNYIMFLFTIVSGPIEILLGVFNSKGGFGAWIRRLASYLMVYPVMIAMVFFAFFFLKQGIHTNSLTPLFAPNTPFHPAISFIGHASTFNPPFSVGTSGGESQLIWVLASLFLFSQITKVVEIVQSMFAGKPFDYGTAIGEAWGRVQGGYGATLGPQVAAIRKYGGEVGALKFYRDLNTKMNAESSTSKLKKMPQFIKDYVQSRAPKPE